MRTSCSNCKFCNMMRPSDITLGDFWQKKETICELNNDNKGLSLILVNTELGEKVFESVKHELYVQSVDFQEYIDKCIQWNLKSPTPKHKKHDIFVND